MILMDKTLLNFLRGLREHGIKNDIPNVTDSVARFLNMLIRIHKPAQILEIGCANGYSTIWMAEAAKGVGAKIHTIDHSKPTFEQARQNIPEAGFESVVEFYFGDALAVIPDMPAELHFDFVFVDGQKADYLNFFDAVKPRLNSGAVLIFDDMMAFPQKTKNFSDSLKSLKGFQHLLIPIDSEDGILLMIKN